MNNYRFGVDCSGEKREAFREILKEERKEYRGYHPVVPKSSAGKRDVEPEFSNLQNYIAYMRDEADDKGKLPPFTAEHIEKLCFNLKQSPASIVEMLKAAGLNPAHRDNVRHTRGYRSTENVWAQNPSFATSGQEAIIGFASGSHSGRAPELGMSKKTLTPDQVNKIKSRIISNNKSEKLGPISPERDRERLRLIREGNAIRSEEEERLSQSRREAEARAKDAVRRERLLLRMMGEAEVIQRWTGSTKDRIDKCIRFLNMIKLYEDHYDTTSLTQIRDEVNSVKQIFTSLIR